MKVIVLTNPELGWDCVLGVFSNLKVAYKWYTQDDEVANLEDENEIRKFLRNNMVFDFEQTIIE